MAESGAHSETVQKESVQNETAQNETVQSETAQSETMHRKTRILTLNNISSLGLQRFPVDRYQTETDVSDPDAILVRSHNMHDLDIAETVKAIGRAGAGTNNIPVARLSERGIPVFNTPARTTLCTAARCMAAANSARPMAALAGVASRIYISRRR